MSKPSKQQRKERLKQWKDGERQQVIASMPMTPLQLSDLLEHLDDNLTNCDHTTKLTRAFLEAERLDSSRALLWLAEHGGYCDCEVLWNLDDLAESLSVRTIPSTPGPKKKRAARDLQTSTGWDLSSLPQPWRVANLYEPDEPLRLELGKRGGCRVQIIETPLPFGDQTGDEYWSGLWYARTELPEKRPLRITHGALNLPGGLRSILVQTPD